MWVTPAGGSDGASVSTAAVDRTAPVGARGRKAAHSLMRGVNRSLLVEVLRTGGPHTRVDLARSTGLSKPTVSAIVEELLTDGLVTELGPAPTQPHGGRPAELLAYNLSADAFAGIQFGATRTHVALADGVGRIVAEGDAPAAPGDVERAVRQAAELVRDVAASHGMALTTLRAVGAAVPGLVRSDSGICEIAPNLGWRQAPVGRLVGEETGLPTFVINSSAAAAHAEGRTGRAAGRHSFVWVYTGTGIGAGVVVHGEPYGGAVGFAGEIGHCPVVERGPLCSCGNHGCLEVVAGAGAIAREAETAVARGELRLPAGMHRADARAVAAAAAAADPCATAILESAGRHLGRGVAYLMNILNPGLVVIGGPLSGAGPAYLEAVRASAMEHAMAAERVEVVASSLGARAPRDGVVDLVASRWLRDRATAVVSG